MFDQDDHHRISATFVHLTDPVQGICDRGRSEHSIKKTGLKYTSVATTLLPSYFPLARGLCQLLPQMILYTDPKSSILEKVVVDAEVVGVEKEAKDQALVVEEESLFLASTGRKVPLALGEAGR